MSVSLVTGAMLLAVLTPTSTPVATTTTTAPPPVRAVQETTTTTTPVTTTAPVTTTTTAPGCDLTQANARKGDLVWGFKKSFRQYVGVGLAGATGNSITATNGATITALDEVVRDGVPNPAGIATGAYRFTFDSADYTSPTRFTSRYRGTVAFSYPAHFFTLLLSDPWVTTANGTATLHADIELKATPGAPTQPTNLPDVALARLTPPAAAPVNGLLTWPDVPAALTSSEAFAGFYQAGAPLDPLTMTLAADCATTPTAPPTANPAVPTATAPTENLIPVARFRPTPDLASTGVDAEHGLWAGVVLLLAGLALVLAAYRPRRT
ncbi:HtaA domain-containing protein [Actinokineospora cianjurensis]|uniref:Htaa protein n=1 Tax=Actinokineospora cianjurensis TaxID=585224 RepID=A0A421B1I7_9PSEU|nr:HtaA domain-containing protein [Actinokineospora cianjurensis]RLK58220.1 Htaa protein [Actinokineospora cianjurensis]